MHSITYRALQDGRLAHLVTRGTNDTTAIDITGPQAGGVMATMRASLDAVAPDHWHFCEDVAEPGQEPLPVSWLHHALHCWNTDELRRDFDVIGFQAPYVVVTRKLDGRKGSLQFQHAPRVYFDWTPHEEGS